MNYMFSRVKSGLWSQLVPHLALLALTTLFVRRVEATEGINLIGVGPVQQGTAGAGVAAPRSPSWVTANPAGIVATETGVDASLEYFAANRTIRSTASGVNERQHDDSPFYIPAISITQPLFEGRGAWGIGLFGSSGMGVDYDYGRIGPPGGQKQFDQRTELSVGKMIMAYAHKFDDDLSIGAGPVLVLSNLRTDMFNARGVPSGDHWDQAYGGGFIVGVHKRFGEHWAAGVSYMSEQWMSRFDDYNRLLGGSLNLPQQATAGVAWRALESVELALDYRWIGWDQLDTFGDTFGWDDQHIGKFGVTWEATKHWTLRSGISHGNSPITGDNAFSNGLFPAIMKTHAAAGVSYTFERLALDAAFVHAFKESVTSNGKDAGGMGEGTNLSMFQNSLTIGARWLF